MFKKLTLAGVALMASSGIAFADTNDSMNGSPSDTSTVTTTTTATDAPAPVVHHKKYKHHVKHKHHRHYYKDTAPQPVEAAAPSYKGEAPCPACVRNVFNAGAYVGLGAGSVVNYNSRGNVYNGLMGTLFGGYGMLWDQIYGALEIFGQGSAQLANYHHVSGGVSGNVASSWGYGLSVLPGYLINDSVLGYLRLGVVNTRFTTRNNNATGGQVGLGMQTSLTPCWDLRGEYIYSFYNSITSGVPRTQQFNLGLLYKFQV